MADDLEQRAETYLRCRAEDELLDGEDDRLRRRARTLVSVGMLSEAVALKVLDGFAEARSLRLRYGGQWADEDVDDAGQAVVHAVGRILAAPWGEVVVRYVSIDEHETRVGVRIRVTGTPPPSRHRGFAHGPPDLDLRDARGAALSGHFSGTGSDTDWEGAVTASPGLPGGSTSITVLGQDIALNHDAGDVEVEVHRAGHDGEPAVDRARRFVEHLARGAAAGYGGLYEALDAERTLIECGVLPADSELCSQPRMGPGGQPVRHYSARRRVPKAHLERRLGVSLDLGSVSVTLLSLESSDVGFRVDVVGTGRSVLGPSWEAVDPGNLVVDARDERGNRYTGRFEPSSSEGAHFEASLVLEPALADGAARLELRIAGPDRVATVRIPLDGAPT